MAQPNESSNGSSSSLADLGIIFRRISVPPSTHTAPLTVSPSQHRFVPPSPSAASAAKTSDVLLGDAEEKEGKPVPRRVAPHVGPSVPPASPPSSPSLYGQVVEHASFSSSLMPPTPPSVPSPVTATATATASPSALGRRTSRATDLALAVQTEVQRHNAYRAKMQRLAPLVQAVADVMPPTPSGSAAHLAQALKDGQAKDAADVGAGDETATFQRLLRLSGPDIRSTAREDYGQLKDYLELRLRRNREYDSLIQRAESFLTLNDDALGPASPAPAGPPPPPAPSPTSSSGLHGAALARIRNSHTFGAPASSSPSSLQTSSPPQSSLPSSPPPPQSVAADSSQFPASSLSAIARSAAPSPTKLRRPTEILDYAPPTFASGHTAREIVAALSQSHTGRASTPSPTRFGSGTGPMFDSFDSPNGVASRSLRSSRSGGSPAAASPRPFGSGASPVALTSLSPSRVTSAVSGSPSRRRGRSTSASASASPSPSAPAYRVSLLSKSKLSASSTPKFRGGPPTGSDDARSNFRRAIELGHGGRGVFNAAGSDDDDEDDFNDQDDRFGETVVEDEEAERRATLQPYARSRRVSFGTRTALDLSESSPRVVATRKLQTFRTPDTYSDGPPRSSPTPAAAVSPPTPRTAATSPATTTTKGKGTLSSTAVVAASAPSVPPAQPASSAKSGPSTTGKVLRYSVSKRMSSVPGPPPRSPSVYAHTSPETGRQVVTADADPQDGTGAADVAPMLGWFWDKVLNDDKDADGSDDGSADNNPFVMTVAGSDPTKPTRASLVAAQSPAAAALFSPPLPPLPPLPPPVSAAPAPVPVPTVPRADFRDLQATVAQMATKFEAALAEQREMFQTELDRQASTISAMEHAHAAAVADMRSQHSAELVTLKAELAASSRTSHQDQDQAASMAKTSADLSALKTALTSQLTQATTAMKEDLATLQRRVDARLNKADTAVTMLASRVDAVAATVETVKERIVALEQRPVYHPPSPTLSPPAQPANSTSPAGLPPSRPVPAPLSLVAGDAPPATPSPLSLLLREETASSQGFPTVTETDLDGASGGDDDDDGDSGGDSGGGGGGTGTGTGTGTGAGGDDNSGVDGDDPNRSQSPGLGKTFVKKHRAVSAWVSRAKARRISRMASAKTTAETPSEGASGRELTGSAVMMRFERQRAANALVKSTVFTGLSMDDAMHLVEKGTLRCYEAGQLLIKQGQRGNSMMIVIEGEVVIYLEEAGNSVRELTRRYRGQVVGEFALISSSTPRSASCVAAVTTTALMVTRDVLRAVLAERPDSTVKLGIDRLVAAKKD